MEPAAFRRRVIRKAVAAPTVIVPVALGTVALAMGVVLREPAGFFGFLGVTGLLLGAGVAATRLLVWPERLAAETARDAVLEEESRAAARLLALERHQGLDEVGPRQLVGQLRRAWQRIAATGALRGAAHPEMLPEIGSHLRRLHDSCCATLERCAALGLAAREMATTEGRVRVQAARRELLDEVGRSVEQLDAALDRLQATALDRDRPPIDLAMLRDELDEGLRVARRLDERMDELERSLQGGVGEADHNDRSAGRQAD
jgi:hypothetical protein